MFEESEREQKRGKQKKPAKRGIWENKRRKRKKQSTEKGKDKRTADSKEEKRWRSTRRERRKRRGGGVRLRAVSDSDHGGVITLIKGYPVFAHTVTQLSFICRLSFQLPVLLPSSCRDQLRPNKLTITVNRDHGLWVYEYWICLYFVSISRFLLSLPPSWVVNSGQREIQQTHSSQTNRKRNSCAS